MARFNSLFDIDNETKILDIGGTTFNWQWVRGYPEIDLLNLIDQSQSPTYGKPILFLVGDGLNLKCDDNAYDIVYSNSVIEHLGTYENQEVFAKEIKRVGNGLFIQTPAYEFFLEPHYWTPFIHWLPVSVQKKLLRNFTVWGLVTRSPESWIDKILSEIRLLNKKEFHDLFADCTIIEEKFLFFTKSYIAYRPITKI